MTGPWAPGLTPFIRTEGDQVEWSNLPRVRHRPVCGHCQITLHHLAGNGPRPASARFLRTLKPSARTIALCSAHAADWDVRDRL